MIVKSVKQADKHVKYYETQVSQTKDMLQKTLERGKNLAGRRRQNGTARNIRNDYYKIAGKTGTAQKIVNGRYIRENTIPHLLAISRQKIPNTAA
jgi:cell division protein FtsI (penicillin-binding protein 3)